MKKSFYIGMFFLLGLFICNSFAVEVTLLGPKQYLRVEGKPKVITDPFPGRIGTGTLIIKNGTIEGTNRISSAIISINGQVICGANDFNLEVYDLILPCHLDENNTISVELRSKVGSYLWVEVKQEIEVEGGGVIGSDGGVVEVNDPISPLYGAGVMAPEGTLPDGTLITIDVDDNPPSTPLPEEMEIEGDFISFETSTGEFEKPLYILIPFPGERVENEIRLVFLFNSGSGEWEKVQPLPGSSPDKFLTMVHHFSSYVRAKAIITDTYKATGFSIDDDTHSYRNDSSVACIHETGEEGICNGMALLAAEYFNNWVYEEGISLRCRWELQKNAEACCDAHGRVNMGSGTTLERILVFIDNILMGLEWLLWEVEDNSYVVDHIISEIYQNRVVPILLLDNSPVRGHAVVATGWEKTGPNSGKIIVYDVNDNEEFKEMTWMKRSFPFGSIHLDYKGYPFYFTHDDMGLLNIDETLKDPYFAPEPDTCPESTTFDIEYDYSLYHSQTQLWGTLDLAFIPEYNQLAIIKENDENVYFFDLSSNEIVKMMDFLGDYFGPRIWHSIAFIETEKLLCVSDFYWYSLFIRDLDGKLKNDPDAWEVGIINMTYIPDINAVASALVPPWQRHVYVYGFQGSMKDPTFLIDEFDLNVDDLGGMLTIDYYSKDQFIVRNWSQYTNEIFFCTKDGIVLKATHPMLYGDTRGVAVINKNRIAVVNADTGIHFFNISIH